MAPSSPRVTVSPESTAVVWDVMVADTDFLECGICFLPLKPPIFQCAVGHVVCSLCLDKLKDAGKCHLCGVAMAGGYQRCHAMERAVDSVRAPCPHAPYGCDARPAYHAREEHLRECPHGACHCPAGEACGFVGSTTALLDHISSAHNWPFKTLHPHLGTFSTVCLRDGFNFVVSAAAAELGRKYLFLLNVVRHPFWRAVSVICIYPRSAAAKEVRVVLGYGPSFARSRILRSDQLVRHEHRTEIRVAYSDLSDGLPDPNGSCQFIVPGYVHGYDEAGTMVGFRILTNSSSDQ